MAICDLTTAYPILQKAADAVRPKAPELARHFDEFKDCIEAFEKSGLKTDLEQIQNKVVIILDLGEGHFNTDGVDAAVFITIEVQRAAQAKFASDGFRCKAHLNNVTSVKLLP